MMFSLSICEFYITAKTNSLTDGLKNTQKYNISKCSSGSGGYFEIVFYALTFLPHRNYSNSPAVAS